MKKLLLITICLLSCVSAYSQGRSKPGKYVERYDFPYSVLTYDDGRVYTNGTMKMWVDIESEPNAIFLQWHDSNGDYIEHEFFAASPAPLVIIGQETSVSDPLQVVISQ